MKTKEELNVLKEEVETLNKKLAELTEEELNQVTGGDYPNWYNKDFIIGPGDPVPYQNEQTIFTW